MVLKRAGKDYWGRMTYKDSSTGRTYKKVDGVLHTITKEGEPLAPFWRAKDMKEAPYGSGGLKLFTEKKLQNWGRKLYIKKGSRFVPINYDPYLHPKTKLNAMEKH